MGNLLIEMGQSSAYLSGLAPHEKMYSLMLLFQFLVKLFLEFVKCFCFITATRDSFCLALTMGGANLYEVLDVVVVYVIWGRVTSQRLPLEASRESNSTYNFPTVGLTAAAMYRRTSSRILIA